jgi:hypothetical protein
MCIFNPLCSELPHCFKIEITAAVHIQPGGIRRSFDKPPPRQLSLFSRPDLVQALLKDHIILIVHLLS